VARYLVATHTATLTRDWLCKHCHAHGQAIVQARGRGERRLWFSRASAADGAHQEAAVALDADADRIAALIRCPHCRHRRPGAALATAWRILPDLFPAATAAGIVLLFCAEKDVPTWITLLACTLVLLLVLAIGDERRRWRQAGRAQLQTNAPKRRIAPAAPVRPSATDPYRAPPAPPPVAVVRPPTVVPTPSVQGDGSEKPPTFLT
jgi:hypothetical protein